MRLSIRLFIALFGFAFVATACTVPEPQPVARPETPSVETAPPPTVPAEEQGESLLAITPIDSPHVAVDGAVWVRLPFRFRLTFQGAPVDQDSVTAAVIKNLGAAHSTTTEWRSASELIVTLESGPDTGLAKPLLLSARGGRTRAGEALTGRGFDWSASEPPAAGLEMAVFVAAATRLSYWTPATGESQAPSLPGPYLPVSASPDGKRLLLGLSLPAHKSPWTFGYWYDIASGRIRTITATGTEPLYTQDKAVWLRDGSLYYQGSPGQGALVLQIKPDGSIARVAGSCCAGPVEWQVDPTGKRFAAFMYSDLGHGGGALNLIDLESGKARDLGEFLMAFEQPLGPAVGALWSPDSQYIAYRERTTQSPARVVLLNVASGEKQVLAEGNHLPRAWAPDSQMLLVDVLGLVVVPSGKVTAPYPQAAGGAFSPDGARISVGQAGLFSLPDQRPLHKAQGSEATWSPDGTHLALADGERWTLLTRDGQPVTEGRGKTDAFLWQPAGRYLAVPGAGILDTASPNKLYPMQARPIAWTGPDTLLLAPLP